MRQLDIDKQKTNITSLLLDSTLGQPDSGPIFYVSAGTSVLRQNGSMHQDYRHHFD